MKLIGKVLLGALLLIALAAGGVYALSTYRLAKTITVDDPTPPIPTDSASIAHGEHLVRSIVKCVDCHGDDLGGKLAIDAGPVGRAYGPNLTRGRGGISARSDADLVNAIRHGVTSGGKTLRFMPVLYWQELSDADVGAIVAYLRAAPPVDRDNTPSHVGPLGRALYVAGKLPFVNEAELTPTTGAGRTTVTPGRTLEYGRYLARIGGCLGCHGENLAGGPIPGMPPDAKPASNLTPGGIGKWTEADFTRALREGRRPDGSAISEEMPWKATRLMTEDEIHATWLYVRGVPAREFGSR